MSFVAASRWLLLVACLGTTVAARPDRRIVDRVTIGDVRSEHEHAYDGDDVTTGVAEGRVFRQTGSWMRYALTVFDDTEVAVACVLLGTAVPRSFDLVVEGRVVASHTFVSAQAATVEFRVPLELTKGRTNILVMLRATNGATPALLELRSVQDHNE